MKLEHYEMMCAFDDQDWVAATKIMERVFFLDKICAVAVKVHPSKKPRPYRVKEFWLRVPAGNEYSWSTDDSFVQETYYAYETKHSYIKEAAVEIYYEEAEPGQFHLKIENMSRSGGTKTGAR